MRDMILLLFIGHEIWLGLKPNTRGLRLARILLGGIHPVFTLDFYFIATKVY